MDDVEKPKFEVVWTTLPLVSAFLPTIGHVGIADSAGVIRDFSGPYTVTRGKFMCGPPKRVWRLEPSRVGIVTDALPDENATVAAYDAAVARAARVYEGRMHNIVTDNCHSHVARTLNEMRYDGRDDWNMIRIWAALWLRGHWVSSSAAIHAIAPTVVIVVFIVLAALLPALLT